MSRRLSPLHRLLIPLQISGADEAGLLPLPSALVIARWGESERVGGGKVIVGPKTLAALAANQEKAGFGEIALDFAHNTYETGPDGKPAKPREPIPVAAYGTLSVQEGVGIVFTPTRWTPEGKQFYQGGHYRDLSPTIAQDDNGEVLFVHSVALCRQGQVHGLHAYAATLEIEIEDNQSANTKKMDPKALLLKILGLPETATDEEIMAAADALKPMAAATPDKPAAKPEESDAALTAMAARLDTLERQQLVNQAAASGKVIPLSAEALAALPLNALSALIDGLPANQVPVKPNTTATGPADAGGKLTPLSAEDKAVCAQLGLTEEQFRKA